MQEKVFTLINRGMNRDLSVSKAGESSAYENHNIRISAREHETFLSVTNERGNKEIPIKNIAGELVGWNVLNNHVILFCHGDEEDYIYRVDYDGDKFNLTTVFHGNLGFDTQYPIESVISFETDSVQKIYWLDGKHVLRFMNFMDEEMIAVNWNNDPTYFDSNRTASFRTNISISKDNSGNNRPNGVVQYFLTYYNNHGQETGRMWASDLVYLSPIEQGGSPDGFNNNKVTLTLNRLDTSFTHFRVYSIFRSTLDGSTVAYIVGESKTSSDTIRIVDDGAHLTLIDSNSLLYLGSQPVVATTMTHKDDTLFLGDLVSIGHKGYGAIDIVIKEMYDSSTGISNAIEFIYSDNTIDDIHDIKYLSDVGNYPYSNQLQYSSSEISTFKGGEKYRFGLKFKLGDGTETQAFWIGDAVNDKYPIVDESAESIKRVVVKCTLPDNLIALLNSKELEPSVKAIQLVMAEATIADRSVKAQGIVNPTMFNTWERYNDRLYGMASWFSRPRGSVYANHHFDVVHRSNTTSGEIACNFWSDNDLNSVNPYFQYQDYSDDRRRTYTETFDGQSDYDYIMYIIEMQYVHGFFEDELHPKIWVITAKNNGGSDTLLTASLPKPDYYEDGTKVWSWLIDESNRIVGTYSTGDYELTCYIIYNGYFSNFRATAAHDSYLSFMAKLSDSYNLSPGIDEAVWKEWEKYAYSNFGIYCYANKQFSSQIKNSLESAVNYSGSGSTPVAERWISVSDNNSILEGDYQASYYKKHLMFVDENLLTFNSPELESESVLIDSADYKFRIVGVAKMSSVISDYTVDATPGKNIEINNVKQVGFSGNKKNRPYISGIITWSLWEDNNIKLKPLDEGEEDSGKEDKDRKADEYMRGADTVYYWLYAWGRIGNITAYRNTSRDDEDLYEDKEYSVLNKKRIANLRFSYKTIYGIPLDLDIDDGAMRFFNYSSSQFLQIKVGDDLKYYDGVVRQSLTLPGTHKYPVIYSYDSPYNTDSQLVVDLDRSGLSPTDDTYVHYRYVNDPVMLEFSSNPHMLIGLKTIADNNKYTQTILPYVFDSDKIMPKFNHSDGITGWLLPWIDYKKASTSSYPYIDYAVNQEHFIVYGLNSDDEYLFIGEIYQDFSTNDTRYGGITESAIQNCRFIPAGPQYTINSLNSSNVIYGNRGDTYFQRWDCVKTLPYSDDAVYGVTDIVSVLLETHINLDGRYDKYRGGGKLVSYDYTRFGQINPVYSQKDNFSISRDLDEDFNTDAYRSSVTWTLQKKDLATIDEWSHITLASTMKLDGDKGFCRALRRFQNSIISFQDRGIAEILFNSRTQLSTQDGVPVEIANSGKVDGKRYITNKYGCVNKWSIVEGKNALYFVDNINKAFCAFGNGIDNLSAKHGFSSWFKKNNSIAQWTPKNFENIVSFYDRVHSDVYLVKSSDDESQPCLVYNELLDTFTSFFDYARVPMMTNIGDRFVSYRDNKLWLQNEGFYCNYFGEQYDFWMTYRVTPNPYNDKIWTNVEYRADFYRILDEHGNATQGNDFDLTDLDEMDYQDEETFDVLRVWNEYQSTDNFIKRPKKKFRIWRYAIPRALSNSMNLHSLDRIRNPWVNIIFKKSPLLDEKRDLMQAHDFVIHYFE